MLQFGPHKWRLAVPEKHKQLKGFCGHEQRYPLKKKLTSLWNLNSLDQLGFSDVFAVSTCPVTLSNNMPDE